ncbi:MAG: DNA-3-methyladenine glycosylase [Clostridiales Family XIII bacterium]|jgi:3-methyladenine DNA glycosylase Mpg|nr:DNA-3-methyladenine glycosylase [Clostridiales Family XIII bacterium]
MAANEKKDMVTEKKFFEKSAVELAQQLLGKIIRREFEENGEKFYINGRITETEAYCSKEIDSVCHDHPTQHKKGGTIYYHRIWGWDSFDIVANKENVGEGVLIRHIDGYRTMHDATVAFDIEKVDGSYLLDTESKICLVNDKAEVEYVCSTRKLGEKADKEAKEKPWRFVVTKITLATTNHESVDKSKDNQ